MIGFGGKVQLGGHGLLRDDARPALRVTFLDEQPRPDHLDQLWRAEVLDTFDGRAWSNASSRERAGLLPSVGSNRGQQHVRLEVLPLANTDFVFSPGLLTAFSVQRLQDSTQYTQVLRRDGGDARLRPRPPGRYSYEAWGRDTAAQVDPELTSEVRARALQLPPALDGRVAALARGWVASAATDREKANVVLTRLRHDFTYSLELPGDVADPVANFLFERKQGHCEYFSTAMVLLLRTLGIPAREVAGFSGGDRAPGADYYVVRAGDSHTWVEASLDGQRWTTFDPTPDVAREAGPNKLAAWWSATGDELDRWWQANIVDYDLLAQFRGLKGALDAVASAGERFRRDEPDVPGASKVPWRALGLLLVLVALVLLARWLWLRRRGVAAPVAEEVVAMEAVLGLLAARGGARRAGETLREWLARLDASKHPLAENARQGVLLYEQSRFAAQPWGATERARVQLLLGRLKRAPLVR
jgi:transglutaminase-like putative cysteine protease